MTAAPAPRPPERETQRSRASARSIGLAVLGIGGYCVGVQAVIRLLLFLIQGPDSGPTPDRSAAAALAADLGLIALFAAHHSLAARELVKRWLARRAPPAVERSLYTLVSGGLLLWICAAWQPLPHVLWDMSGTLLAWAAWTGFALGWSLSLLAAIYLNQLVLFGLLGGIDELRGAAPREPRLVARGPYRFLRHPMYVGFAIAAWSTPRMTAGHALLATALTGYAIFGARLEERDLDARLGGAYGDYRRQTRAVLPWPRGRGVG